MSPSNGTNTVINPQITQFSHLHIQSFELWRQEDKQYQCRPKKKTSKENLYIDINKLKPNILTNKIILNRKTTKLHQNPNQYIPYWPQTNKTSFRRDQNFNNIPCYCKRSTNKHNCLIPQQVHCVKTNLPSSNKNHPAMLGHPIPNTENHQNPTLSNTRSTYTQTNSQPKK